MSTLLSEFNLNVIFDDETNARLDSYMNSLSDKERLTAWKMIGAACTQYNNPDLIVNAISYHRRNRDLMVQTVTSQYDKQGNPVSP